MKSSSSIDQQSSASRASCAVKGNPRLLITGAKKSHRTKGERDNGKRAADHQNNQHRSAQEALAGFNWRLYNLFAAPPHIVSPELPPPEILLGHD
jgi:hypothetical protein